MGKEQFNEIQYLGRDYIYLTIRLVAVAFCFAAYVYERDRENTQDLYLIAGFTILGISIFMMFLKHYETVLIGKTIEISGLWTSKKIIIDLLSIEKVRKDQYSTYIFNSPVYNLHKKGALKFHTSGNQVVVLTDKDGLEYVIGTQRPIEFLAAIDKALK